VIVEIRMNGSSMRVQIFLSIIEGNGLRNKVSD